MENDPSLIESMQLALQAQEEIKQQLLTEIASLESNHQAPKLTEKSYKFYKTSLSRAVEEKRSLKDQIEKFRTSILPEIHQQFDRIHQKRESMEQHIASLQKYRDMGLVEAVSNRKRRASAVATFHQNLDKEIQDLTQQENELQGKTAKARTELHILQEQYLNSQRESAKQNWESELANECGINRARNLRRRSNTVSGGKGRLQPPNLGSLGNPRINEMPIRKPAMPFFDQ